MAWRDNKARATLIREAAGRMQPGKTPRTGGYADMIASMTLLNRAGTGLAKDAAAHAMTDVTGFGLFGHAMEIARDRAPSSS